MESAAKSFDPLAHAREAQGPRFAIRLAAGGETAAIVGDDDHERIRLIASESNGCLPGKSVLADVGQGFLDEPEDLKRCERWELVGRAIRSKAHANPMPLLKLIHVVLEGADQPSLRHVGAQPRDGLADVLEDFVGNAMQSLEFSLRLLAVSGLHQLLDRVQAQEQIRDELGGAVVELPAQPFPFLHDSGHRHDVPLPAAALQFPFGHASVVAVIPGPIAAEEVRLNLAWMRRDIPDALWVELSAEGLIRRDAPTPRR